jgi:O-antigen/teichoic acid export membrane protein
VSESADQRVSESADQRANEAADQLGREAASQPGGEPGKKPESLRTKVSKAMFWNTVLFPFKTLVRLLTSLIVINGLRANGYGTYQSLVIAAGTISLYTDLGLEPTLPKFLPEVEVRFGRSGVRLFMIWFLGLKLFVLLLVVSALQIWTPWVVSFFNLPESSSWLVAVLGVLVLLGSFSNIMIQILFTFFKQRAYNLLDILTAVVQPLLTALLVLLGLGVAGALVSLLITTVLILGLQIWQARLAGRELTPSTQRVQPRDLLAMVPRFWPFAMLNYLINVSRTVYEPSTAVLVLNGLKDTVGIGMLTAANSFVGEFVKFLVAPLSGVQMPLFSRLYARDDRATLQTAYSSFTRLLALALIPTGIGLILLSRGLIQMMYLSEFSGAAAVAIVLIIGNFLDPLLGSLPHVILMAYERYRPVIVARLLILCTLPLLFWLAPRYSAMGAALAMTVARLAGAAVVLGYATRAFALRFPWPFLRRVLAATAAFTAILLPVLWVGHWGLFDSNLPVTILQRVVGMLILVGLVLVAVVVFLFVFKRLGGLEEEDRERVAELRFPLKKWILRWL